MALMLALRCSLLMLLNLPNSLFSEAKACTMAMPVMCSCTKALRLATALRTRMKDLFTLSLKK